MYTPAFAHLLHKIGKLASLLLPLLIYAACGGGASVNPYSEAERKAIDSVLLSNRDCDTLLAAAQQYAAEGNAYGEMAAYRELGKRYREESRFAEAIEAHKQGLQRAVEQCDTIQIIQALNNIGTNFRRMGILDEASSYHYQALAYSDAYSDKESFAARKNRVVSLNGIGNVHLSLDNRETADSVFRLALAGEHALGSALGQAINCANIGALFEADGRLDSAKYYYVRSMQFNREANSPLGISLCHTHFGRLQQPAWKHGDVVPLIRSIAESHATIAATAGITLAFEPQEKQVLMDYVGDYVQKIVQNLLSNAIKFTAPGGEIHLSTSTDGRNFVLRVSDTGIGFTPEQKEHIFKPFYQVSNDTQGIGTGIGLSLVSLSVEKMKGTIEVHSAPGEGSVFTVILPIVAKGEVISKYEPDPVPEPLPVAEAGEAAIEQTADDGDVDASDGTHVLIVEDTPEVARYMKRQFPADAGYRFHFAADGEEALEKARQLVPDLIITDVMMPRMDGFELCRRVRADELICHVPVIMVTARATHEDRLQGLQAGADAYLEKPFHADELTLRAAKLLEQRELLRRKYSEAVASGGEVQSAVQSEGDKAFIEKVTDAVRTAISSGKGRIDYDALAYALCLSRAQLNRKVKAVTGCTTTDFILQIRIAMAKQYLDCSNLSIWEIALRCGMDSDSYFCTLFKKCTGMTPLQYKNREK